jgi:ubiquinone/menaquinone biosynthesis C-methylase UbiE
MSDKPGLFNFTSVPDGYRQYLQPAVFDPWARELLAFVPPASGDVILDVASGTGAVAHAAARMAGPEGRVIASDVSPLMLARSRLEGSDDRAAVEPLESPADHLDLPDGSVDVVYCQQGLQFMPDRHAAMTEMFRVLRPGGMVGVAVWSDRARPEPFASYARILRAHGIPEPYPDAYDTLAVTMSEREIEGLLTTAGSLQPLVRTVDLPLVWPEPQSAAFGITGSTYGPAVAALTEPEQEAVFAAIVMEASAGGPPALMKAVVGRGVAGSLT